jgi:hypothetical protein
MKKLLDRCQRALDVEIAMTARIEPRQLGFERPARAFAPFVPVRLKRPRAENEVDEHKLVGRALRAEFADQIGQFFGHPVSPAALNTAEMAEVPAARNGGRDGDAA